jgi:hypothetical protein
MKMGNSYLKLKVITLKLKVVTLKLKVVTLKLKVITFGDFLRFEECFSYSSEKGKIISFKVNDRQYLEFIEDSAAKEKKRMVSVSLEVDDVKEMEVYLTAKNVNIIGKIRLDNAGNEVIAVDDGYGNRVEFISFRSDGLHKQSQGRFLSEKRISTSIHHAGLYTDKVKNKSLIFVPNLVRPCGTRKDC